MTTSRPDISTLAFASRTSGANAVPLSMPIPPFARAALPTGVTLRYVDQGDPDGAPLILLHGLTDSWFSWSLALDRLPARVRAIALDQRGHGGSDRPLGGYTLRDYAADVAALLDVLAIERATIVGHSLGSFVAQRVALDHPHRVARLVLVGAGTRVVTPAMQELNETVQSFGDAVPLAFVREFQEGTVYGPLPDGFLDAAVLESTKLSVQTWRAGFAGFLATDVLGESHRIAAPTLVVNGTEDAVWPPPEPRALVETIRGARLLLYEATGHAVHWEQPDRFVRDLLAFVEETPVRRGR